MKTKLIFFVACLTIIACKSQTTTELKNTKVTSLFNGENLDNWKGDKNIWSVENGCIVGRTTDDVVIDQNTFLIFESEFSDFELSFTYKIIGGNSGVQYRSKIIDEDKFVVGGYQADMEAGIQHSGILYEEKGRGIVAKRGEYVVIAEDGKKIIEQFAKSVVIQSKINQNQWNNYKIVVKGNHLQHFINDNKTIDVIDNEVGKKSEVGVIALQVHKGPNMEVFYKNLIIKILN